MSDRIQNDIEKIEQALNIRLDDVEIEIALNAAFPQSINRISNEENLDIEYNLNLIENLNKNSDCSSENDKLSLIRLNSSINLCYQRYLFQLSKYSQTISLSTNRKNKLINEIVPIEIFEIDKNIFSNQLTTNNQPIQSIRRMIQREEKLRLTSTETIEKLIQIVAKDIRLNKKNEIEKKIESLEKAKEKSNVSNERIKNYKQILRHLKSLSNRNLIKKEYENISIDWKNISQLLLGDQYKDKSCEFVWKQICLPKIHSNEKWSQQEDQLLKHLVQTYGENALQWNQVASHFPKHSLYMCINRYMYLENTRLDQIKFSKEKQNEFKSLIEKNRCGNYIPLNKIAYKLGSSLTSVRRQWRSIDPSIRRGSWNIQEDNILLESISKQKNRSKINWNLVSSDVIGRSQNKCYQRYIHLIRQDNQQEFLPNDDQLLIQQHFLHHGRWSEIQKYFPGRSCYTLQNRYKKLLEFRQINDLFYSQQLSVQLFLLKEYSLKSSSKLIYEKKENFYEKPEINLSYKQLTCLISNKLFEDFCNKIDLNQINNHITIRKLIKQLSTFNNQQQIQHLFIK